MLRSMPVLLILVILSILCLGSHLPQSVQQCMYAMSLTIKSVIIFLLPVIIFSLLFKTMVNLANRATAIIALILVCVCCSNFMATFLSHYVGEWIYQLDFSLIKPEASQSLLPTWFWEFPKLIDNNKAMFAGIILGILAGNFKPILAQTISDKLDHLAYKILRSFAYLIPIFVAGFIIKLQYEGVINIIMKDYALIFIVIALAQFGYIGFVYAAINKFNFSATFASIKNMLPAAIAGFSSMSSAAVMPLTIMGATNNVEHKELAGSVVPATVNVHLIGDCIAIPVFAYALMKSFGMTEPNLMSYSIFVFYFVIAKFSVAGVPGGGIIIMLPILENYLGFSPEMLSLITALYILFDPVITCANVLGNGAFAKMIDKLVSLKISSKIFVTQKL